MKYAQLYDKDAIPMMRAWRSRFRLGNVVYALSLRVVGKSVWMRARRIL